ncbi:MAG: argininosuccinate lyase [Microbacterium sp.]
MNAYAGFRGAGIRLAEEQVEHLQAHRTELLGDSLPAIHAFDKAHVTMLTETGLLEREHGVAILRAFREMEAGEGVAAARIRVGGGMHSGEHYLIDRIGPDVGGRVHLGRSSGDLIEVARRMTIRHHLLELIGALDALRRTLLVEADRHASTVMPGYTHGQQAQPTTYGHWLAMMERAFARDVERMRSLWQRLNLSPAGAAIMTGSDFPLDRQRTTELLGFDAPLQNTMDAILSHDLEMEVASVYAICGATLARIADDLYLWSTMEFRFVEIPDRYCGTSSIMPQKKNPDALEDVKSVASRALAGVVSVVTAERGPTGFPIMERRQTQDLLWDLGRSLRVKAVDLEDIVRNVVVAADRMHRSVSSNWAQVTDLASAVVRTDGIDWRHAHQVVGMFVRLSEERGLTPETTSPAVLDEAAQAVIGRDAGLDDAAFAAAMDVTGFVERRTLYGGPNPQTLRANLAEAAAQADDDEAWLQDRRDRIAASERLLESAIDRLIA